MPHVCRVMHIRIIITSKHGEISFILSGTFSVHVYCIFTRGFTVYYIHSIYNIYAHCYCFYIIPAITQMAGLWLNLNTSFGGYTIYNSLYTLYSSSDTGQHLKQSYFHIGIFLTVGSIVSTSYTVRKLWRVSLYVTDDDNAKLYVTNYSNASFCFSSLTSISMF